MSYQGRWILFLAKICYIIDLPLSFAFDTICLPYDAFQNWKKEKDDLESSKIIKESDFDKVNEGKLKTLELIEPLEDFSGIKIEQSMDGLDDKK